MKINRIIKFIGENNSKYENYKGIFEIDDNNLKQGVWGEYWEDGKLYSKGNYVNGKREGYWEEYWSNGKLREKGDYVNGKREGYWEAYFNGELCSKGNYVNGQLCLKRNYVNRKNYEVK